MYSNDDNKQVNSEVHADYVHTNQTAGTINNIINNSKAPVDQEVDLQDINNKLRATYQQSDFTKISLPFATQNPMYLDKDFVDMSVAERTLGSPESDQKKTKFVNLLEELETTILNLDQEKRNCDKRNILLLGKPGAGKSTYIKNIAYRWSLDKSKISYDWIFYIPLKEIVRYSTKNLSDVIYHYWAQHFYITKNAWDIAWKKIITQKVLILFNGYDEVSSQLSRTNINRLLQEVNHFGAYILSTRPYHLHNLPEINRKYELLGFDDKHSRIFVKNYLNNNALPLLDAMATHDNLNSMMKIPLNAALVCMIWQRWPQYNFNMTVLYQLMVNYLLCRYKRTDDQDNMTDPAEIRKHLGKIFDQLYSIALTSMESGKLIFQFDMNQFSASDIIQILTMGLVMATESSESITELSQKKFCFSHLTFQEYFVAEYYANLLKSRNPNLIKKARAFIIEHKFDPRYSLIFNFISGMLKDDVFAINMYFDILLEEPHDLLLRREVSLLISCLDECQVTNLLAIKDELVSYIKRFYKSISCSGLLLYQHHSLVNHTNIVDHLISSLRLAINKKQRDHVYEMMRISAHTLNASDCARILRSVIEIAKDLTISIRSHDACETMQSIVEKLSYQNDKTNVFYSHVVDKISLENVLQHFSYFKAIVANRTGSTILRLGAIKAMRAMLDLTRVISWENFLFHCKIIFDESDHEEIILEAISILNNAIDSYEIQFQENEVSDFINRLLEAIVKKKPVIEKRIHGAILGKISSTLKMDENKYYGEIFDFIWNEKNSKNSRLEAANALREFLNHCKNIKLYDLSCKVIATLKNPESIKQPSFEIALNFFFNPELIDIHNHEEEVLDVFLMLLGKPIWNFRASILIVYLIDKLDIMLINKIIARIKSLMLITEKWPKYLYIINSLPLSKISQERIDGLAMLLVKLFKKMVSTKSILSISDLKSICDTLKILSEKSSENVSILILKYLEQMNRDNCSSSYFNEILITAYHVKIHLHPNKINDHIYELIKYIKDDTLSCYELSDLPVNELLLFYQNYAQNDYTKKIISHALVRKFYSDQIALYIDDNIFLNFQENGEFKQFKLSYAEANQIATDIQEYAKEKFDLDSFKKHNNLSPQSRFLCYLSAPVLLAFGAKALSRPQLSNSTHFNKCNII